MSFVAILKEHVSSLCAVLVIEIMAKLEDTGHFVFRRICVDMGRMRLAIVSMLQCSGAQNKNMAFFSSSTQECTNSSEHIALSLCSFISRGTRNHGNGVRCRVMVP